MKHYIKPIIGSVVIVSAFAFGALLARPVDALQSAHQKEMEAMQALVEARKEKCDIIRLAGGECNQQEFGNAITQALADFR